MDKESTLLRKIAGKHTIETLMDRTGLSRASTLNLLSKLRKKKYLQTEGGGKQKRIYTISTKTIQKGNGLFTILNKYAKIKIVPSFVHIAHGPYTEENALIDAIEQHDFRIMQAAVYLFAHIKNWKKFHALAKKKNVKPIVGALYDLARTIIKVRKMPEYTRQSLLKARPREKIELIIHTKTDSDEIKNIEKVWNVSLPFSKKDVEGMK